MRRDRRAVLVLLASAVLAPPARATILRRSIRLQMEGYVGPPPEGRTETADLTLGVGGGRVRFQVTKATVLTGNVLAADFFDALQPYRPNMNLRGPKELIDPIAKATPGARLVVSGQWVGGGGRDFLLASVEAP